MSPVEHVVDLLSAKRNGAGWIAKCPAHEDRQPSLSIDEGADGKVLLKCFAGCTTKNVVAAAGLTMGDLFPTRSPSQSAKPTRRAKKNNGAAAVFDFHDECVTALNGPDLIRLGNERCYSRSFCKWLHENGHVGTWHGDFAFPVCDHGKIIAAHYRVKPTELGERDKWFYHPKGVNLYPFVIGNLTKARQVHIGESPWDILALADRTGLYLNEHHAFVATRGASNAALCKDVIQEGVSILLWSQNDGPGQKWLHEVAKCLPAPIGKAVVPSQFKDLNDWTKTGASVEDIYLAMFKNELIEVPKLPDLGTLLDEICVFVRKYISFTSEAQPVVIALWIVHTWFVDCFEFTPYLHVFSPTRSCGKSHLLECIAKLVRNVLSTVSLTVAALFRTIEQDQPTLLIDEVDTIFGKGNENEELRAILNAGFERGSKVRRCVGPNHDLKDFAVFCPKALAGIGRLPDTVSDRCIPIHLIAKKKSDKVQRFRKREVNVQGQAAALEEYSQKPEIAEALRNGRAEVPEISDRQNDIAEGLIVIADLAGGDWPDKVRKSLIQLFSAKEEDNTGVQLLASCRVAFRDAEGNDLDRIATKDLLEKLIEEETGTPWAHWWENDLNKTPPNVRGPAARIAGLLRPFGIKAEVIKLPDNKTARGYLRKDFEDNWNRYCPLPPQKDVTM
jgi:hypothetical protein